MRAQSTLEYVLVIVIGLLLVMAVIIVVRGNILVSMEEAENKSEWIHGAIENLSPSGAPVPSGTPGGTSTPPAPTQPPTPIIYLIDPLDGAITFNPEVYFYCLAVGEGVADVSLYTNRTGSFVRELRVEGNSLEFMTNFYAGYYGWYCNATDAYGEYQSRVRHFEVID